MKALVVTLVLSIGVISNTLASHADQDNTHRLLSVQYQGEIEPIYTCDNVERIKAKIIDITQIYVEQKWLVLTQLGRKVNLDLGELNNTENWIGMKLAHGEQIKAYKVVSGRSALHHIWIPKTHHTHSSLVQLPNKMPELLEKASLKQLKGYLGILHFELLLQDILRIALEEAGPEVFRGADYVPHFTQNLDAALENQFRSCYLTLFSKTFPLSYKNSCNPATNENPARFAHYFREIDNRVNQATPSHWDTVVRVWNFITRSSPTVQDIPIRLRLLTPRIRLLCFALSPSFPAVLDAQHETRIETWTTKRLCRSVFRNLCTSRKEVISGFDLVAATPRDLAQEEPMVVPVVLVENQPQAYHNDPRVLEENAAYVKRIAALEAELEKSKRDREHNCTRLKEASKIESGLRSRIGTLEEKLKAADIVLLQAQLQESERLRKQTANNYESARAQIARLESELEGKHILLADLERRLKEPRAQKNHFETKNESPYKQHLDIANTRITELEEQIASRQHQLEEQGQLIQKLRHADENLRNELKKANQGIARLGSIKNKSYEKDPALLKQVHALQDELERCRAKLLASEKGRTQDEEHMERQDQHINELEMALDQQALYHDVLVDEYCDIHEKLMQATDINLQAQTERHLAHHYYNWAQTVLYELNQALQLDSPVSDDHVAINVDGETFYVSAEATIAAVSKIINHTILLPRKAQEQIILQELAQRSASKQEEN